MNRESVIIKTVTITAPAQIKLFQIKIPREIDNIIGIELGLHWTQGFFPFGGGGGAGSVGWKLPMQIKASPVVGDIKLQSFEQPNIFYAGELALDRNIDYGDFSSRHLKPKVFTHQLEACEDEVKVSGSTTLIQGVFKDKLHIYGLTEYRYTAKIYVWTQTKETINSVNT